MASRGMMIAEPEKMSIEQLKAVKEQSDQEVNLLQYSLNNIRTATTRKKMLVLLTASLYVPGTLDDAEKVLVDVGTGYFIENRCEARLGERGIASDRIDSINRKQSRRHKIQIMKTGENLENLFEFTNGQGLPGRSLAKNTNSKVFSHSLLAKTVVCFPYLEGIVEFGIAESFMKRVGTRFHLLRLYLLFSHMGRSSFPYNWKPAIKKTLDKAIHGPTCRLDSWNLVISMPVGVDLVAPHSLKRSEEDVLDQVRIEVVHQTSIQVSDLETKH
ncbi:hypothetical protein M8C21_007753 [Ambrosia artemisiifolia]|uniref:Uncharacterized protein n=1 Tax=Ambrosia artemisiifolia TaxID=4212 RepID=A0AAD5BWR0_AMBAR|nr:hypothetical protein M8C21_007753 [Ambrosia artemisiifolia]